MAMKHLMEHLIHDSACVHDTEQKSAINYIASRPRFKNNLISEIERSTELVKQVNQVYQ